MTRTHNHNWSEARCSLFGILRTSVTDHKHITA